MYKLLPRCQTTVSGFPPCADSETSISLIPEEFIREAVFAGGSFWGLEAAFGRVDGVIKTATGYCGGTLKKPTYSEVCEAKTGHTEAVKVICDKRTVSYRSLCDIFWDTHDPTKKDYLVYFEFHN